MPVFQSNPLFAFTDVSSLSHVRLVLETENKDASRSSTLSASLTADHVSFSIPGPSTSEQPATIKDDSPKKDLPRNPQIPLYPARLPASTSRPLALGSRVSDSSILQVCSRVREKSSFPVLRLPLPVLWPYSRLRIIAGYMGRKVCCAAPRAALTDDGRSVPVGVCPRTCQEAQGRKRRLKPGYISMAPPPC